MNKYSYLIFCLLMIFNITTAQKAEGGGAYIINNGKLINCIVKDNYALNGFGVAGNLGEVINSNIVDNQYLNFSIINPGDMYANDGKVFTPEFVGETLIFPPGYKASDIIGVCFWSNTNNNYLEGKFWVISVNEEKIRWCTQLIDIDSVPNFSTPAGVLIDYNGLRNTNFIVTEPGYIDNHGSSALTISNCAAKYCYEYLPEGSIEATWFLPSIGQLRILDKELIKVNKVLIELGKSPISSWYWSSSEVSKDEAWKYHFPMTDNRPANSDKNRDDGASKLKVRAMSIISINKK